MNKGRIHGKLRYFFKYCSNLFKIEQRIEVTKIRDFNHSKKRALRKIHGIKNHSI